MSHHFKYPHIKKTPKCYTMWEIFYFKNPDSACFWLGGLGWDCRRCLLVLLGRSVTLQYCCECGPEMEAKALSLGLSLLPHPLCLPPPSLWEPQWHHTPWFISPASSCFILGLGEEEQRNRASQGPMREINHIRLLNLVSSKLTESILKPIFIIKCLTTGERDATVE